MRIEWQLYELDNGELHRCPPKDDSYRTIDTPPFLSALLTRQIERNRPKPCACHGRTYVFSGHGAANGAARGCARRPAEGGSVEAAPEGPSMIHSQLTPQRPPRESKNQSGPVSLAGYRP
ncbi:hypothetical protein GCM10010502_14160 [Kitasatospora aureofaciens]|uniref:Uncharacterized protein n=1 Tax=Kitasatospora aureofaciens TaxID=1894 RepID=A0A8H9HH15_KITAU|nr:hypothetical protein GCM10010502_14160 [Kitasatospora aureofaciens]